MFAQVHTDGYCVLWYKNGHLEKNTWYFKPITFEECVIFFIALEKAVWTLDRFDLVNYSQF
mgnify:CR=1 FL=1